MLNNQLIVLLKGIPIFSELNESQLEKVAEITRFRTLKKGTAIYFIGERMREIYFVESGIVKIFETDFSGREQILQFFSHGDMFPYRGIFEKGVYPANASVYQDARLLCIDVEDFRTLLLEKPKIALTLLKVQNQIIVDIQSRLNEKIMHDTREQIIKLLLRLTQSHGKDIGNYHYKIMVNFTNQELANMIGTSRETMNRMLTSFKKEQYIYEEDGKMVIDFYKIHDEVLY